MEGSGEERVESGGRAETGGLNGGCWGGLEACAERPGSVTKEHAASHGTMVVTD